MSLLKLRGPPLGFIGEYCLPFHLCLILLASIIKLITNKFNFFFWGGGGGGGKRVGAELEEASMATLARGAPKVPGVTEDPGGRGDLDLT